jgi:hypothetical protein
VKDAHSEEPAVGPRSGAPFNPTDPPTEPDESDGNRSAAGRPRAMPIGIPLDQETYERLKRDPASPHPPSDHAQEDPSAFPEDEA